MPSHQQYVDAIKLTASSAGKKALVSYISKKLPFLFIPVIGPVTSLLLGKIVEILIEETEFAIFFKYIDLRIDAQGRAFNNAVLENYKVQRSGSEDEKKRAEKELINSFRKFAILRN